MRERSGFKDDFAAGRGLAAGGYGRGLWLALTLAMTGWTLGGCAGADSPASSAGDAITGWVDTQPGEFDSDLPEETRVDDSGEPVELPGTDEVVERADTRPSSEPAPQSSVVSTSSTGRSCEVTNTVQIGVWGSGGSCEGEPAFILEVDLSQACFGWERSLPNGETRWNSATNLRCYKDRVCYTQHPASGTCEGPMGTTDKQWLSGVCSAGTMIVGGTDDCPEAPEAGCPLSEKLQGSNQVACGQP